jgi:hypothetical protein
MKVTPEYTNMPLKAKRAALRKIKIRLREINKWEIRHDMPSPTSNDYSSSQKIPVSSKSNESSPTTKYTKQIATSSRHASDEIHAKEVVLPKPVEEKPLEDRMAIIAAVAMAQLSEKASRLESLDKKEIFKKED